jgi:hypothetical protein
MDDADISYQAPDPTVYHPRRLNAKLRQVKATPRRMRHLPIPEQGRYLRLVLNGFYNHYAVPTKLPFPQRLLLPRALPLAALPPATQPAT